MAQIIHCPVCADTPARLVRMVPEHGMSAGHAFIYTFTGLATACSVDGQRAIARAG